MSGEYITETRSFDVPVPGRLVIKLDTKDKSDSERTPTYDDLRKWGLVDARVAYSWFMHIVSEAQKGLPENDRPFNFILALAHNAYFDPEKFQDTDYVEGVLQKMKDVLNYGVPSAE